jgi:hypothetical protein
MSFYLNVKFGSERARSKTEKRGMLRGMSPLQAIIEFTSPIAKSFSAYKGKRHKMLNVNRRRDVMNIGAVCLHPLEHRKILE